MVFLTFSLEITSNLYKSCKNTKKNTCIPFTHSHLLLRVCHFCIIICILSMSRFRSRSKLVMFFFFPEPFERELHILRYAFPKHRGVFLHNHSIVISLRAFNVDTMPYIYLLYFYFVGGSNDALYRSLSILQSRKLRSRAGRSPAYICRHSPRMAALSLSPGPPDAMAHAREQGPVPYPRGKLLASSFQRRC